MDGQHDIQRKKDRKVDKKKYQQIKETKEERKERKIRETKKIIERGTMIHDILNNACM